MFKESQIGFQNQTIDTQQGYSYPISKITITRFKDQKRMSTIPFPKFHSPKKSQKLQDTPNQKTNTNNKAQKTVAFMKSYIDKVKRERKINSKKRYSVNQSYPSGNQQTQSFRLPEFCAGQKINLRTIENGIETSLNNYSPPYFLKYKRQKSIELNMETEREKERIADLLKQIKKDKQKMSRMLSPIIHRKSRRGSIPILEKEIEPPENIYNYKKLQPWKQERKGQDFQIEDFKKEW